MIKFNIIIMLRIKNRIDYHISLKILVGGDFTMLDLLIGIGLLVLSLIDFYFSIKRPGRRIRGRTIWRRLHINEDHQRFIHRFSGVLFLIGSILFFTLAAINFVTDHEILTKTIWSVYMIICVIIIEIYIFSKTLKW